ncbi:hypothetical protein RJ55_03093 [Drechmeria coniospora]|nr:hypothetical protein RJ55_03093 [Drechmeria coniospora]
MPLASTRPFPVPRFAPTSSSGLGSPSSAAVFLACLVWPANLKHWRSDCPAANAQENPLGRRRQPEIRDAQALPRLFPRRRGLDPHFAEDYSVFNTTPGNLSGAQGPFADFIPATPSTSSGAHKRLLSAEGLAAEIASHANHFSPDPGAVLPPVHRSRRLPSSPDPLTNRQELAQRSPTLSVARSAKKSRRGPPAGPPETSQVVSPPPTARKGERMLAPKPSMHNDQPFGQPDFVDPAQPDMGALLSTSTDFFNYPMSAPATAPVNLWDPVMSMGMDLDFNVASAMALQSPTSSHRHTGSFDWNADIQLFQDINPVLPSSNQENVHPARAERALAPKPPAASSDALPMAAAQTTQTTALDGPLTLMTAGDSVDPGLLFSRPQTSAMDADFNAMARSGYGSAEEAIGPSSKLPAAGHLRKSTSLRGTRSGKLPGRALASSPIKPSVRPGLGRSYSENRGRRALGRAALPTLAPAARPEPPQASRGTGVPVARAAGRSSGRISPSKTMSRLSSLASIPETSPHCRPRLSVRLTIDAHGRARAETTDEGEGLGLSGGIRRSKSARVAMGSRRLDSSDDDSSTDDEPIIIPSRNSSFHASFALPDPHKPVGSIFHSSRRSISDRSASNSANDAESEAETVINERQRKGGDATSELRKVVEDRQKRSSLLGSARSQRFTSASMGNFPGGIISPTSLAGSSCGPEGLGVRCLCDKTTADDGDGFMLQCEACEMWLHGACINVTRRSRPSVYICLFCVNTPNKRSRENALGIGAMVSPLANKYFRSFR